jgi:hypothetical protein
MKKEITRDEVRNIHSFYGVILSPPELIEETQLINSRLNWLDETKTAVEICHQYAEQRSNMDFDGII